jgi:hypothetical protein
MRRQTSGDPACGTTPGPDPDPEDGTAMSTSQSDETGAVTSPEGLASTLSEGLD